MIKSMTGYGGASGASGKLALTIECKRLEGAVNLMDFGTRYTIEGIVKNIIFRGLMKRVEFLDEKCPEPEEEGEK